MNRNVIQMRVRIDGYLDRSRSPRFSDKKYVDAINDAIERYINDLIEPLKVRKNYSFESTQRVRDRLQTLVTGILTQIPSAGTIPIPSNYFYYLASTVLVDSITYQPKFLEFNKIQLLENNPFLKPSKTKPYLIEFAGALQIKLGTDAVSLFTAYDLYYVKKPAIVSMGKETDKIVGTNTVGQITSGAVYYTYDDAVQGGITYYPGDTFTASSTTLTSGTVILTTNITNCDLPDPAHDEICRIAAMILSGTIEDYNKKQDLKIDISEN